MRVLIVGLGSIARRHIAALRAIDPATEMVALRSGLGSSGVEGVLDVRSLDEAGGGFDFAIVSNPTSEHAGTIRSLLPLGIPLFIEKPLFARCGSDGDLLLERIREAGILTYVACNMRFLDTLVYLRRLVAAGMRVNEVNVYCGSYLPEWRPGTDWRRSYSARPELGGGVHTDLIHEFDYVHWIFGDPVRVRKSLRHSSSLGIEAIDYANYCLEYDDFCVSIILNYYRRDYKRSVEIVAADRTVCADLDGGTVKDSDGKLLFESRMSDADVYRTQMEYFISLLGKPGAASSNDVFEAYGVLGLCLE